MQQPTPAWGRTFCWCFLANVFLLFGILTTDRLYNDDLGRAVDGFTGWTGAGRPLADVEVLILNLWGPLVNIAPLPQFVSIAIISAAAVYVCRIYGIRSPLAAALCTLPFAGQPYFLENMSYSFDCPTMVTAMALAIVAAGEVRKNSVRSAGLSSVLLIGSLLLYQAATSVFVVASIFLVAWEGRRSGFRKVAASSGMVCGVLACAAAVYLPFSRFLVSSGYAKSMNQFMGMGELNGIGRNIGDYFQVLWGDWGNNIIGFCACFLVVAAFAVTIIHRDEQQRRSLLPGMLAGCAITLAVLFSFFPTLLMKSPVLLPRTLMGVGAVLGFCSLHACGVLSDGEETCRRFWLGMIPVVMMSYALLVFSYSFARANAAQKDYENMILPGLFHDASQMMVQRQFSSVAFIGSIGTSPVVENSARKFPAIRKLVPIHIREGSYWGHAQLKSLGMPLEYRPLATAEKIEILSGATPAIHNSRYSLYALNDVLVIKFRPGKAP